MLNSVTGRSMPATGVTLTRIEIGMLRINNLRVAFADVAPFAVFGLADRPALLLGTDALRGLKRMSLDFHNIGCASSSEAERPNGTGAKFFHGRNGRSSTGNDGCGILHPRIHMIIEPPRRGHERTRQPT
jgi:hypothetical protein